MYGSIMMSGRRYHPNIAAFLVQREMVDRNVSMTLEHLVS